MGMSDTRTEEKAIDLAQKLIAKAESTDHPEERDAFLKKAHQIMEAHALDMLRVMAAGKPNQKEEMTKKTIRLFEPEVVHMATGLVDLATAIAKHCRCRILLSGWQGKERWGLSIIAFGFTSDVEYYESLLTSLKLHLISEIDPPFNIDATLPENVYVMKNAGMAWKTIAFRCGFYDSIKDWNPKDSRWIRWYKEECKKRGEEPHGSNPKSYQTNFAISYASTIRERLEEMRRLNDDSTGAANGTLSDNLPALVDHEKQVTEFMFASAKVGRGVSTRSNTRFDRAAASRGNASGMRADLGGSKIGGNRGSIGRG